MTATTNFPRTYRLLVRGHDLVTRTNRAYAAIAVRPEAVTTEAGTYVAFARVEKRSDNLATLRRAAKSYNSAPKHGALMVIVDLESGAEVA